VAIEQYYRSSKTEQKIRPRTSSSRSGLARPVDGLRTMHDKIREEIARSREDTAAGGAGQIEH